MKPALFLALCFALSAPVPSALAAHAPQASPAAANSLAGIKIGMDKDDAHAALIAQGASSGDKDSDENDAEKGTDSKRKGADPDDARPEVWTLKGTPYARIAFASDDNDKILWVTAFARPGQGVPFAQIGSLARAAASGPAFAVWNVISPRGSYRVIARGSGGRAAVVSLLPLKSANPNGAFSPQIMPKQNIPKTTPK